MPTLGHDSSHWGSAYPRAKSSVLHVLDLGLDPLGYQSIGRGLAASGGLVPGLSGVGCAQSGSTAGLLVTNGLEGFLGFLVIGEQEVSLNILGGELLVFPFALLLSVQLDGVTGLPGSGDTLALFPLNDPSLAGLTMICQAVYSTPELCKEPPKPLGFRSPSETGCERGSQVLTHDQGFAF